jgi:integrase
VRHLVVSPERERERLGGRVAWCGATDQEVFMSVELLDAAGRRRSPATVPGYRRGCPPRKKDRRYPADPPRVEEIIAVMRAAGTGVHGARIRALIAILWRAGLRIQEALALAETDLEPRRGSILVRRGKGGKRREVGMDDWGKRRDKPAWRRRCERSTSKT